MKNFDRALGQTVISDVLWWCCTKSVLKNDVCTAPQETSLLLIFKTQAVDIILNDKSNYSCLQDERSGLIGNYPVQAVEDEQYFCSDNRLCLCCASALEQLTWAQLWIIIKKLHCFQNPTEGNVQCDYWLCLVSRPNTAWVEDFQHSGCQLDQKSLRKLKESRGFRF